jgi:hypothetical protein
MHRLQLRDAQASPGSPFLAILVILFARVTALAAPGPQAWQPVVVKGAQLRAMLGAPIASLEVLAGRDGRLQPIPFQVDASTSAIAAGSASRCSPPGANRASLGSKDELAVMLGDFGDRANAKTPLPVGALELAVRDPPGGPEHFAYVAAVKSPQRSAVSYMQFDSSAERVETDSYRFGLRHGWPRDFSLQRHRAAHGPNLLNALTVSLSARLFGLIPFATTEHDLRIGQPTVTCGPVRVTLRYNYSVRLIGGLRSPSVIVPIIFYRQYIVCPLAIRFPWLPRLVFRDTRIRISLDYSATHDTQLLWQGSRVELPVNADSAPGQQPVVMDPGPSVDWLALRQDGQLLIQGFPPTTDFDLIRHYLTYHGPVDGAGPVPETRRVIIGYEFRQLETLSAGTHVFEACVAVLDGAADPQTFFSELRAPAPVLVQSAFSGPKRWPALKRGDHGQDADESGGAASVSVGRNLATVEHLVGGDCSSRRRPRPVLA